VKSRIHKYAIITASHAAMGKRKRENEVDETFVVKCALGRLLPSKELRAALEALTLRAHPLVVYGSLLAHEVALRRLEAGRSVPINDQKFWYQCMSAWGTDGYRGTLDSEILNTQLVMQERSGSSRFPSSKMNVILNTIAITMKTNAAVSIAQTFHRNLKRAFSRMISIYEEAFGKLEKKRRYRTLLAAMNICLGARRAAWDANAPPRLITLLQDVIGNWRRKYIGVLPCVFPSNITDDKVQMFLSWSFELSKHLEECSLLEDVVFRKGDMKRTQLLPIASHKVKFIQVDKSILSQCVVPFMNDGKNKDAEAVDIASVTACFPGLEKLRPRSATFQGSVKTDGVSASLVFTRPLKEDSGVNVVYRAFKGLVRVEKTDLQSRNPPIVPAEKQRLIGIDPGRRDMIVGAVHGKEKTIKISTKWYVDKTKRKAFSDKTEMRFAVLTSRGTILSREKEALPCHKVCGTEDWRTYVDALLPMLPDILRVWEQRIFRRQSLKSYIAIDKTLDKQCRAITGRKRNVLVAFGAANSCHTGFGYAPVPQKRLRHRLEKIHGARISLISEQYTSQQCTLCDSKLLVVPSDVKDDVWGVRKCPQCRHRGSPLHVHRDINAARNMIRVYLELALNAKRPDAFTQMPEA
jgi:hypothetical protein